MMWNSTPSHTDVVSVDAQTVSSVLTVLSVEHPQTKMFIAARIMTKHIAMI